MENSKKYTYILEPAEIRELFRGMMAEQIKYRKVIWILLVLILLVDSWLIPKGTVALVLVLAVLLPATAMRNYAALRRQVEGQQWTIRIENGKLKAARGDYSEVPCESIQFIRVTRRLLMLGYLQTPKRPAWFVMPLRVFESVQEREDFLHLLRNSGQTFGADFSGAAQDSVPQPCLQLAYTLNAEKWVAFYKGGIALIHAGILGKRERILRMLLWCGLITVILSVFCSLAVGEFYWLTAAVSLVIAVLFVLNLFYRDPEKTLRRQIRAPFMANRVCGLWRISFSEEGITVEQPGGMTYFNAWAHLAWFVETETVFYIFNRDKKRFIMVAKESFQNWDQVAVFHRLCGDKGLTKLPAVRMHYVPGWVVPVALVILYVLACIYVLGRNVANGIEYEETAYESGEWYSGDASAYVPIDMQVRVLEALGLSVQEEWVESARFYIEEYDMRDQVEGHPYTWLLINMSAPDYGEDGRIREYSDEVFWFDFEGSDYIDILQGMLALSEGSCLDSVTNIREDTEKVDWESGTGTITVSLDWNDTQYRWDAEVYYDWIDGDVLGMLNTLLREADSDEFFYVTGDDGQGAIVFFCSEEWAQTFTAATGLTLDRTFTPAETVDRGAVGAPKQIK